MRPLTRSLAFSETLPAVEDMYVYMDAEHPNVTSSQFTCIATGHDWVRVNGANHGPYYDLGLRGNPGIYVPCRQSCFTRSLPWDFTLTGSDMTVAALTRVISTTTTWRTLMRSYIDDHHIIVESGGTRMGMYDGGGGGFVPSSFNVPASYDTDWTVMIWELSATASQWRVYPSPPYGTYSISNSNAALNRGFYALGGYHGSGVYGTQFWGDLAVFACWNRFLTTDEKNRVKQLLNKRIV